MSDGSLGDDIDGTHQATSKGRLRRCGGRWNGDKLSCYMQNICTFICYQYFVAFLLFEPFGL